MEAAAPILLPRVLNVLHQLGAPAVCQPTVEDFNLGILLFRAQAVGSLHNKVKAWLPFPFRSILHGAFSVPPRPGDGNRSGPEGSGVICDTWALPLAVIPAKAGIYSAARWKCSTDRLDSPLRGNDSPRELPCLSNDATIGPEYFLESLDPIAYNGRPGAVPW